MECREEWLLTAKVWDCLAEGLEFARLRLLIAFEALLRRASSTCDSCTGGAPETVELLPLPVVGAGGGERDGRGGGIDCRGGERMLKASQLVLTLCKQSNSHRIHRETLE